MGMSSSGRAHSVHSMVGTSYPSRRLRGSRSANRRHSQCTRARLQQFRKVPVYLLPWRCPQKHHAPYIPIIHPLSFIFFLLVFFFLWMSTFVKKKKRKKEKRFLIREFCFLVATDNLQSAFLQREVPQALGFSMVQNGMLWLEHTPATLLWDSSTKRLVGRWRLFHSGFVCLFFSPLLLLHLLAAAAFLGHPALDVPLHVKSQMVGPGETSVDAGNIW